MTSEPSPVKRDYRNVAQTALPRLNLPLRRDRGELSRVTCRNTHLPRATPACRIVTLGRRDLPANRKKPVSYKGLSSAIPIHTDVVEAVSFRITRKFNLVVQDNTQ